MKYRISLILLGCYWMAMIIGTHIPADQLPYSMSWGDKVYHCLTYGGLALLVVNAFGFQGGKRIGWRTFTGLVVLLVLHGAVDELTQSFIPGRFPSIGDWIANSLGGIVGVTVCYGWQTRTRRNAIRVARARPGIE